MAAFVHRVAAFEYRIATFVNRIATLSRKWRSDSFATGNDVYHVDITQQGAHALNPSIHANLSMHAKLSMHARRRSHLRSLAGFTLIELMIAVAIVAILTAIAYPAYRNYVIRGQVVYATNALSSTSANMERWFQDNRTYVGGPCATAASAGPAAATFTVSCPTILTATTFTITAVGSGSVAGFTYTIDQSGTQTSTVVSPAPSAWILSCPASWETKAGSC
jgi:type IV pilus assembly protein PilE